MSPKVSDDRSARNNLALHWALLVARYVLGREYKPGYFSTNFSVVGKSDMPCEEGEMPKEFAVIEVEVISSVIGEEGVFSYYVRLERHKNAPNKAWNAIWVEYRDDCGEADLLNVAPFGLLDGLVFDFEVMISVFVHKAREIMNETLPLIRDDIQNINPDLIDHLWIMISLHKLTMEDYDPEIDTLSISFKGYGRRRMVFTLKFDKSRDPWKDGLVPDDVLYEGFGFGEESLGLNCVSGEWHHA